MEGSMKKFFPFFLFILFILLCITVLPSYAGRNNTKEIQSRIQRLVFLTPKKMELEKWKNRKRKIEKFATLIQRKHGYSIANIFRKEMPCNSFV